MLKTYSRSSKPRELPGELPVEFESACRLCLEKYDAMVNIFGDTDIIPIVLKIRTCITIDVSEDDKLPNMVCQSCLNQLDSFYTFKKRCLATNVKLKQYVALPPSQTNTRETQDINEYLDLTLSEDGNEEDIKNACTITWEEKQGTHAPIFEFPVALMNREEDLPARNQPDKKTEPVFAQENVDSAGYISEDSMEDFAGFEEQSEYEEELKKRLQIINIKTNPQGTSLVIQRGRGRPKKITNPLQCGVCYIMYKSEQEVKEHMASHVSKVKSCAVCQKSFNNRSMLQRHLRVHTGERPFPCDVCGKAFSQKEILLRHKVLHSGERPYVCHICERTFSLPEALKSHLRLQHSDTSEATRYHCCRCNKVFCHASGLSRHQLRHSGVMFSCTICNKVFTDSSSVKRHLRSHPKDKKANAPLQYEIIKLERGEHSYSLLSKTDTEESINTVSKVSLTLDSTSSICALCSKEFNSEDELKTHYRSMHKGNKYKFICDHCDKEFRFATGLSRHLLTHSVNNLKGRNIKVETKTNKIKKGIETRGVKRQGLRVRPFESISNRKKKTKNVGTTDESIEELAIRKEKSKTNQDLPRGINDNQESSINGEIVDHSEEISCKEDEIYYEEKMDDSEVICDTQEEPKNGEMMNHSHEISDISKESKNGEMVEESVEISIVPDKSIIQETVLSSEGIGIMSKKIKNEVTMDNSVEISIILKESNGETAVDSEEIGAMAEDSINGEMTVNCKEISVVPEGSVTGESLVDCEEIDVIPEQSKNGKRINDSEQIHIMPNESIKEEMSVDSEELDIISEESKDGKMMDDSDKISILADESISEEIDVDSVEICDMPEKSATGETFVDSEEISVISEESKDGKTIDDSEDISILPDESINEEMSVDSKEIGVMSEDSTNEKMVYDSKVTEKSINEVDVDSERINFRIKNSNTVDIIFESEEMCGMSEDSKNRIMLDDCGEINIILEKSINEETGVGSDEIDINPKETKNVEIVGDLFDKNSVECHESNAKEKMNVFLSGKNNVTQKESKNGETENDPRKEITVKKQTAEEIEKEIFG